jgi:hypothetical protein
VSTSTTARFRFIGMGRSGDPKAVSRLDEELATEFAATTGIMPKRRRPVRLVSRSRASFSSTKRVKSVAAKSSKKRRRSG